MTEKEQQFNQWFDEYANGVKVFEEADMKQAYLQGRAELEAQIEKMKLALIDIKSNTDDVNIEWQIKYLFDELEIKEK